MRALYLIVGAMLLVADGPANAGPQPICADRPGKAWATCTVPRGHVEIDIGLAGWSLQNNPGEHETEFAIGEAEIRYGLTDRNEIAFDMVPLVRTINRAGGTRSQVSGVGDLTIFSKNRITPDNAAIEVALVPLVKVPTAKQPLGNGKWEGALLVPIGYSIAGTPLSIALTPELDWVADSDGHGHHAAMAQVASLGWQASEKLSLAAELWAAWDWDPAGTVRQASADGSVAFLLSNDVQVDAGANLGLNRQTPDVELYTGISMRF
jgi:hypothetical protein